MDGWIDAEVPPEYAGSLMVIRCGAHTLTVDRDDAMELLQKMQEKIGEMATPNTPVRRQPSGAMGPAAGGY